MLVQARERAYSARRPSLQMKQAIPMKSFLVGRSKLTPGFLQVWIYLLERELPLTATLHQKRLPPPSSSQRTWNKKSGQVCCTNRLSNSNGFPTSTACTRPVNCRQEYKEGQKGSIFLLFLVLGSKIPSAQPR